MEVVRVLSHRYRPGVNSATTATAVHRRAYDIIGCPDPYEDLKRRSNAVAESLLGRATEFVESAEERLEAACLVAIAGNVLDFGIGSAIRSPEMLVDGFESLIRQGLDVNEVPKMERILRGARSVVYLVDNCGEIVLDKILVSEIKRYGARIVGVVKGDRILTDATAEDAEASSISALFDRMLDTGGFAVGIDLDIVGDDLIEELQGADLIVSKGMANFESLSDSGLRPIAYLLRAKCLPVARTIGAARNDNVVRVYE